jgi:hypothetical protein
LLCAYAKAYYLNEGSMALRGLTLVATSTLF